MKRLIVMLIAYTMILFSCSFPQSQSKERHVKRYLSFDPKPGLYEDNMMVTITSSHPISIRYTTDGTEPTLNSRLYTEPIEIKTCTTIKAKAFGKGWKKVQTISGNYVLALKAPTTSHQSGIYDQEFLLNITEENKGATIHYTIDGSEPTKSSFVYQEPLLIERTIELRAKSIKKGWQDSSELRVGYVVTRGMVFIPEGSFEMGSSNGYIEERPIHTVELNGYYIGKCEVTQKEWFEIMGHNPSYFRGDDLPVEQVSWYDTINYCNKRSIREGLEPVYNIGGNVSPESWVKGEIDCNWSANGYRLPTEAEWEYAAKGGNHSEHVFKYAGSNSIKQVAWYYVNSNMETHSVGVKQENSLGIYDMSGNVSEWVWDRYAKGFHNAEKMNPKGPKKGKNVVVKGGSWNNTPVHCRPSSRTETKKEFSYRAYGFRVARSKL